MGQRLGVPCFLGLSRRISMGVSVYIDIKNIISYGGKVIWNFFIPLKFWKNNFNSVWASGRKMSDQCLVGVARDYASNWPVV
jgi:hypothetical protein